MTPRGARPRRAVRPPTGATRDDTSTAPGGDFDVAADDTDQGWSQAAPSEGPRRAGDREEQWWREQHPPHWE